MTIRTCLVLATIVGLVGGLIGRLAPHNATSVQVAPSPAPSSAAPVRGRCEAARAVLASTKVQLAICTASRAFDARAPETEPSGVPEVSEPDIRKPESIDPRLPSAEDTQIWREFVDSDSGALLVRHFDGTLGIYNPDEWPIDGDGVIMGRKLPDGRLGWYAGPDAGPRSDPAAFQPWEPPVDRLPVMRREPDGTITLDGKPASPSVQFMFGGKVEEPAKPQQ